MFFRKKKKYPVAAVNENFNDEVRQNIINALNEIFAEEKRKPKRLEVRKRCQANYVSISLVRDEWWPTVEHTVPKEVNLELDTEDTMVSAKDMQTDSKRKKVRVKTVNGVVDVTPIKTVAEQVAEAYEKGFADAKKQH